MGPRPRSSDAHAPDAGAEGPAHDGGAGLGLLAVGQEQLERGDDAAVRHLAGVLHHVDAELQDVPGADLAREGLLRALAQPLVVDEGAVAALGVLQVELALLVPEHGVVPGEHLAVEDGVVGGGAGAGDAATDLASLSNKRKLK